MQSDDEQRWGKRRRPGQQARAIRVVSAPAPTRQQQQAAARARWNVELILENCRTERPGDNE
jgi:hypothetical protein